MFKHNNYIINVNIHVYFDLTLKALCTNKENKSKKYTAHIAFKLQKTKIRSFLGFLAVSEIDQTFLQTFIGLVVSQNT